MQYDLLTTANPKIQKSQPLGWYTVILHLLPYTYSGYQVCPKARGCEIECLAWSGHGRMSPTVRARLRRTRMYFERRMEFLTLLTRDIYVASGVAKSLGMKLAVRLNGTSDLPWEKSKIMEDFPDIQFYDYTKIPKRTIPNNYHLTFSLDEHNKSDALCWLESGRNVAVIFDGELPETYFGFPVLNGDEHDLRFLDPAPSIVGLKRKRSTIPTQILNSPQKICA